MAGDRTGSNVESLVRGELGRQEGAGRTGMGS